MKIHDHGILVLLTAVALAGAARVVAPDAHADRWDWRNNPDRFGGTMVTQLTDLPQSGQASTTPWPPAFDPEDAADELKALLALEWTRATSRYVGGVCSVGDETLTLDEDGFIIEPECADTNAGGFHVLLTNKLGLDGLSFAVDHDMAAPVRMFPLQSYEVLSLTELDVAGANALLGLVDETYPFDPDAASFAYVATEVVSVDPDAEGSLRTDLYEYLLELDSYGEITGGKWLGDSRTDHPDFTWLPEHDGLDPEIYESDLADDLVLRSQAGDRDGGTSAINKLGAFVNKVEAQRGKKIDDDEANLLVSFAAHASAVLQAEQP